MIRRILPLLLIAAGSLQAADPAARSATRHPARSIPARSVAAPAKPAPAPQTVVTTETVTVRETIPLLPVPANEPRLLETANVLPLALDDAFQFRKRKITTHKAGSRRDTSRSPFMRMENDRIAYGAVSSEERIAREGQYFVFWWRNLRPANVTIRLEYRQAKLGNYVQAREIDFSVPKGTHQTNFEIIGDNYADDGEVVAWRAVIIENQRIVATTQSFLWH